MTATVRTQLQLSERSKAIAYGLGFDLAGIATLGEAATTPYLNEWIAKGFHGEMTYMERGANLRADSTRPEPGMRSAIVVALDYGGRQPSGPIARYARGFALLIDRSEPVILAVVHGLTVAYARAGAAREPLPLTLAGRHVAYATPYRLSHDQLSRAVQQLEGFAANPVTA